MQQYVFHKCKTNTKMGEEKKICVDAIIMFENSFPTVVLEIQIFPNAFNR